WEKQAAIWDEYMAHARAFHLRGIQSFSEGDAWSIRGAVKAAWNIELAAMGKASEIGPTVADSAHRTALRAAHDLWQDFSHYSNQAMDQPANRSVLWDAFLSKWSARKVERGCERTRARLAGELRALR